MSIGARAREISIWDTVGMTARLAVMTGNPDGCRLAYAVLSELFGDDVDLRQSFVQALVEHGAGMPGMLPYEHLARAYLALHAASEVREFDVAILMGVSGAASA